MFATLFLTIFSLEHALCESGHSLLATALFYTDQYSRILLISGPLPHCTIEIIKADINSTINANDTVPIDVVPLYKDVKEVPVTDKIIKHLDKIYSAVFVAEIGLVHANTIMATMRKYLQEQKKVNTEDIPARHEDNEDNTIMGIKMKTPLSLSPTPDDFFPTSVYYAVQMQCADWALGCKLRSLASMNLQNNAEKFP